MKDDLLCFMNVNVSSKFNKYERTVNVVEHRVLSKVMSYYE